MFAIAGGILLIALIVPVLRAIGMVLLFVILGAIFFLPKANTTVPIGQIMTYEQLVSYPNDCSKADAQLAELYALQNAKNFNPDPDNLNEADKAYNSRLKATIWWYAYSCGSKL